MSGRLAVISKPTYEPTETTSCAMCTSHDAPFVEVRLPIGKGTYSLFCIPCVARAIQDTTGWKVLNTFSQWRLQQITGRKTQEFKRQVKEALARGETPPSAPEGVWTPPEHI